ncbi:MAG: tesB [Acidimicrobiales bacterium]|nr:tesB [Acidimicrobiales bacterium]
MPKALDALVELLDLEPIEVNIFRGLSPDENRQRVFGGQVAGQALVAAARTVGADRHVHSLHAYFLRPGDPTVPILYEVDRARDGRSFTTRRVVAIQHGRPIFNLSASFQVAETGFDHQAPMPPAPPPESLPTFAERFADRAEEWGDWFQRPRPIDTRYVDDEDVDAVASLPGGGRRLVWLRADGRLPDDPLLHACVVTYASDMTLLDTTLVPHGLRAQEGRVMMASLDHAMWFHRPFRADEWLLYAQGTPSASGGRGLGWGGIFTCEGALAVSVVQEGLIRPIPA